MKSETKCNVFLLEVGNGNKLHITLLTVNSTLTTKLYTRKGLTQN